MSDPDPARERHLALAASGRRHIMERTAMRAVDDPAKLAKAARIIRAGIARGKITPADLEQPIIHPSDMGK